MISFSVSPIYVLDLRDDFIMNSKKKLYRFLGRDPIKAFHLGVHVVKWFELLDRNQQYLHSKSLRHLQEDVGSYLEQMKYWTDKFNSGDDEEINMMELSDYVYNNMIWNDETEEQDKVRVALFLGMIVGKNSNLDDEVLLYNIH